MSESSKADGSLFSRFTGKVGSNRKTKSSVTDGTSFQSTPQTISTGASGGNSLLGPSDPNLYWPKWDVSPTVESFFRPLIEGPENIEPSVEAPTDVPKGYILAIHHILAQVPKTLLAVINKDLTTETTLNRQSKSNNSSIPGIKLELVWQVENYRSIKITSCPSQESHHVEFEEPTRADLEQANSKADFKEMPSFQIEGWDELNLFLEAVTKGASNYLEIKILVVKARL